MLSVLEVPVDYGAKLRLVGNKVHTGGDFFISANSTDHDIDYLIFLDSRGISKGFDRSLVKGILGCMGEKRYLAVCRPLNLTTWATLYNFLSINEICPKNIVTNMGFVDFTPKKKSILDEAVEQAEYLFGSEVAQVVFAQNYRLNSGATEELYSMIYDRKYLQGAQEIADRSRLIVLNTPRVKRDIVLQRERPAAFFSGLEQSNQFNKQISGATVLEYGEFNAEQTYDAVHYTDAGNELIMKQLRAYL